MALGVATCVVDGSGTSTTGHRAAAAIAQSYLPQWFAAEQGLLGLLGLLLCACTV